MALKPYTTVKRWETEGFAKVLKGSSRRYNAEDLKGQVFNNSWLFPQATDLTSGWKGIFLTDQLRKQLCYDYFIIYSCIQYTAMGRIVIFWFVRK